MSEEKITKKILIKSKKDNNGIDQNPIHISGDSSATRVTSSSATEPPYKMGNSSFILPKTTEDIHLGPQYIVKEEIQLDALSRKNILNNIDEFCQKCDRENQEKTIKGKLKKNKKQQDGYKMFFIRNDNYFNSNHYFNLFFIKKNAQEFNSYIDVSRIEFMQNALIRFVPRKKWIKKPFNKTIDCAFECPKLKSKITFILLPFPMVCGKQKHTRVLKKDSQLDCTLLRWDEGESGQFRDIYYNYLISDEKYQVYEGRSLKCPHDEQFLKEDHSTIIAVGIDYCYPGKSNRNSILSLKVTDTISDFITNLIEKRILSKDFVLDFPDICKNSFLLEKINRVPELIGHVSFYDNELVKNLNISTKIEPITYTKLLFLPKDNTEFDSKSNSSIEILYPFSSNITSFYSNIFLETVYKITFRIMSVHLLRYSTNKPPEPFVTCASSKIFDKTCWFEIKEFYTKRGFRGLDTSIANYFIFLSDSVTYGQIPQNYSNDLNNQIDYIVNIFFIHTDDRMYLKENELIWLADSFELIRDDVWKRMKYSKVDYEFAALSVTLQFQTLLFVYQHLIDSSFSYYGPDRGMNLTK